VNGGRGGRRTSTGAASLAEAAGALVAANAPRPALDERDVFSRCRAEAPWGSLREAGFYPYFQRVESAQGPEVRVEGRPMIMLGSNNYLGLADDARVRGAASEALSGFGVGTTGSRFLNGTVSLHERLERRLARFHRRQAALVFSQGYLANLGVVAGLCGRGDAVVLDRHAHASLLDACRLAQVEVKRFRHNDPSHLDLVLTALGSRPKLVAVDAIYSMHGDVAPVPELLEVCRRHRARLLLDEAHGVGVLGQGGRGVAEHFGLEQEVDLVVGTFSKSFGTSGGYVAGDADVLEFIRHASRPLIFTASAPPAIIAGTLAALEIIGGEPQRRARLWENSRRLGEGLRALGFDTGASRTPILPVHTGSPERTMRMWRGLSDAGVFVNPVVPPAVPSGQCILRVTAMATHNAEQIDRALAAFAVVGRAVGLPA
jgi:8-amino-7-oxononanoate synthase